MFIGLHPCGGGGFRWRMGGFKIGVPEMCVFQSSISYYQRYSPIFQNILPFVSAKFW